MARMESDEEEQWEERASGIVLISVSISNHTVIYQTGINVNYLHRATLACSHVTRRGCCDEGELLCRIRGLSAN